MRTRKQRPRVEKAMPDLTPMIDVTFQLLIFFILCSNFISPEKFHEADLPKDSGPRSHDISPPKEQITIYCAWDPAAGTNSFVLGLDGRGRIPVEGTLASLNELVLYPSDTPAAVAAKKIHHEHVFDNLVAAIESYIKRLGERVERLEIAFALDAARGAASGTAPWMFVSIALDATVEVNTHRRIALEPAQAVCFKFADSLEIYR